MGEQATEKKPTVIKICLHSLIALLDDIVVTGIVLLVLWALNIEYSWPVITVIALLFGSRVVMSYRAARQSLYRREAIGKEAMIGSGCVVVEPLKPAGVVRIGNEYWKARSVEGHLEEGEHVVIVRVQRLVLEVRRKV